MNTFSLGPKSSFAGTDPELPIRESIRPGFGMGKERKPLNPAEAWRRSEKRREAKAKREAKTAVLKKAPIADRDPHDLVDKIQRLQTLDRNGRLGPLGRTRLKHLMDRLNSLNKARKLAGMEPVTLPAPEQTSVASEGILSRQLWNKEEPKESFDSSDNLPPMPDGPCPFKDGVPGLPSYTFLDGDDDEAKSHNIIISADPVPSEQPAASGKRPHRRKEPFWQKTNPKSQEQWDRDIDMLLRQM